MSPIAPTKLLYLVTEDWYFVSHRLALACAAREAGYDVTVVTRVDKHGADIRGSGLNLIPLDFERSSLSPRREAATVKTLIGIYRSVRPAIAHHVAVKPVIYGSIAARWAGVPAVVNAMMGLGYVFSSNDTKARLLRPGVRAALKSVLKGRNTRVIVQNEDDYSGFEHEGLARREDMRLIRGSGVDPSVYAITDPPPGDPIVTLPARLLKDKGVEEFAEAARRLKASGVKARFVLAGDPDPLSPASVPMSKIGSWVKEGVIEHWGWQPAAAMPGVLAQSAVVCLPSYREGLPKVLLEAAAAGRAIVATDVPGCREIVRHGVNGWRVPPRNAEELAKALRAALASPELCRRYGAKGREMVETKFSLKHVIRETLGVYAELEHTGRDAGHTP